ncbi:MAG: hypothetical protein E6K89_05255 [Thaumarchaeota archaeon]|nr:MAG: hypothetical protein E6K89_05255 [Nitrososphaerota archaeon]
MAPHKRNGSSGTRTRLKLFNTISMRKERFESLTPAQVKMFVCGPTIQDYIHVGHVRTYVFYDVLARYLRYLGFDVRFLLNITDIDESIVKGAKRRRRTVESFLELNERAFLRDVKALGISTINSFERVSRYLPVMIQQASGLVRRGHAYRTDGGVYFDVEKFPDFGKLSRQSRDELALRPLEISPKKRNQVDFSLWRPTTSTEQRWESPWGLGTPGWHIQDTAVSVANFGPQYDIHGGARELIYPHHEAEIAQVEALTGLKSEGNVYYAHDLLRRHDVNSVRLYFAGLHHRKDAEFDEDSIERIGEKYWEWKGRVESVQRRMPREDTTTDGGKLTPFLRALDDDIDGPRAVKLLGSIVGEAAREHDPRLLARLYAAISSASQILGIGLVKDAN